MNNEQEEGSKEVEKVTLKNFIEDAFKYNAPDEIEIYRGEYWEACGAWYEDRVLRVINEFGDYLVDCYTIDFDASRILIVIEEERGENVEVTI